jgi:hypothetical protein
MNDAETSSREQAEVFRGELARQWLGLRYANPSYYGLLNVPELESDESAIQTAGRNAKRKLRAYQIGAYRQQSLELLADIGQAVAILTNPEKKRTYDHELALRWKAIVEEQYQGHCEGASRDEAVLEVWLTTCAARGVPVTRIFPAILRWLGSRLDEWPPSGGHAMGLPVGLWMYRDAVILGHIVATGPLEQRAEAVKHIQRRLGLTEGLARLMAEEITRDQHLFARMRIVSQARQAPMELLVRLGARVRRYGGHLGRQGKIVVAVATLLGMRKRDMTEAVDRLSKLKEPPAKTSREAKAKGREGKAGYHLRDLVAERPQGLVIALAILVGVAALVLVVLVATNLWSPWRTTIPVPAAAVTETAGELPAPPDVSEVEAMKEFIKKYPAYTPKPTETESSGRVSPSGTSTSGRSIPTFFSVPATKASPAKTAQ